MACVPAPMETEVDDADVPAESARWARDPEVVWCGSVQGLCAAARDGHASLELGACPLNAAAIEMIAAVLPDITSLSLTNCELGAPELEALAVALHGCTLEGFGLSCNAGVDAAAWGALWAALAAHPRSLRKLDFGDNQLGDACLPALVALMGKARPADLFLDGNGLTSVVDLVPLVAGCIEVDFGDNALDDRSVAAVARMLPGSKIETLVLGTNPGVTSAGATELFRALQKSAVTTLYLDSTSVDDVGLKVLGEVLKDTNLDELHMDQTMITDAGVLDLCEKLPGSGLRYLDLSHCGHVTEVALAALAAALPEAEMDMGSDMDSDA